MRYIDITEFGGPEVLVVQEAEPPTPKADEVLIQVAAAGVNRPDIVQRQGRYPAPPGASPILGLEVAGEVVAVGADVSEFNVGDKVCALTNGGGYAEQAVAPAGQCLPVPDGFSMVEAAALPETCFTVWSNVFDRAKLQSGEVLLIHGGSSGIGTTAIQMAKAMGSKVVVTAGSDKKCDACRQLGADFTINYKTQNFVEVIEQALGENAINVVLDMVGGDYIQQNIQLAAMDGRIVNIAFLKGPKAEVNFLPVMLKRLTLTGSTLRPQTAEKKAAIAEQLLEHIWPKLSAGEIQPVVEKVFPLDEVIAAHQLMASSQHIGKIVLQC